MKRIIPLKYLIKVIIFLIFLPFIIAVLLNILIENKNDILNAILMFLFLSPILGIYILLQNDVNIIINEVTGEVTNNIMYNSDSWKWTRDIKKSKNIYYTNNKKEIYQIIRRKHIPNNLLVLILNNQEIKCIPMDFFTKRQISRIIKIIDKIK